MSRGIISLAESSGTSENRATAVDGVATLLPPSTSSHKVLQTAKPLLEHAAPMSKVSDATDALPSAASTMECMESPKIAVVATVPVMQ